jgi:hypothetical protein
VVAEQGQHHESLLARRADAESLHEVRQHPPATGSGLVSPMFATDVTPFFGVLSVDCDWM